MNINTLKKATNYYDSGQVYLVKETKDEIWFSVDEEDVNFSYRGYLDISCSCEFCGKKGIAKGALCSRKIACILYLGSKFRQKQMRKLSK